VTTAHRHAAWRIGGAVVALILVTACALGDIYADYGDPVGLRQEDVVGAWQSGGGERTITFAMDGTFTAVNLPRDEFGEFVEAGTDRIDGSGTWTTEPPVSREDSVDNNVWLHDVELTGRAPGDRGAFTMEAYRQDSGAVWLFFLSPGEGSWTAYEKRA